MKGKKRKLLSSGFFALDEVGVSVPYEVYESRSKLSYIRVTTSKVIISVPKGSSVDPLAILRQKAQWIAMAYRRALSVMRVVDGNRFLLSGQYRSFDELKGTSLSSLYRRETEDYVRDRVLHYQCMLGFSYRSLRVKPSRSWWGMCSGRGDLIYNSQLAALPERLRDYVVLHEIVHLYEHNHSSSFRERMREVMPDFADREKELRRYSPVLLG